MSSRINVVLGLSSADFEKNIRKVQKQMDAVSKQMQQIGKNMSTYVTAPIIAMGVASVAAFDKQAKAIAQVEAGLKSTGNQVGFTSKELQKMAADLQSISLFGDEDILQGVTAQLLTFTNIAGKQFEQTQLAALNLATRMDGDLKSASIQLGKALNDPVANLSALSRSGIQFSESQKALIKSMWETGRQAEAQTLILKELENQFGGSAEAAAKAGAGPIKQFQMALGDLSEEFGKILTEYITPLTAKLKEYVTRWQQLDEETKRQIVNYTLLAAAIGPVLIIVAKLIKSVSIIIGLFAKLPALLSAIRIGILALNTAIIANPIGALITVLTTAAAAILLFTNRSKEASKSQHELKDSINGVNAALGKQTFETLVHGLKQTADKTWELTGSIENLKNQLPKLTNKELESLKMYLEQTIPNAIRDTVNAVDDLQKEIFNLRLDEMQRALALVNAELEKKEKVTKSASEGIKSLSRAYAELIALSRRGVNLLKVENENIHDIKKANQAVYDLIDAMKLFKAEARHMPEFQLNLGKWEKSVDRFIEGKNRIEESVNDAVASAIAGTAYIIGEMAAMGEGFSNISKNVRTLMLETLASLAIEVGRIAIGVGVGIDGIKKALKTLNPLVAIAAGVALVALGSIARARLTKIAEPRPFADGGIVSGPTNALIGEYPGARNNPEVVAPLDKLAGILMDVLSPFGLMNFSQDHTKAKLFTSGIAQMIGHFSKKTKLSKSGSSDYLGGLERNPFAVQVYGVIRGKDIYITNKRYNSNINRTT